jgi:hypothetical protein
MRVAGVGAARCSGHELPGRPPRQRRFPRLVRVETNRHTRQCVRPRAGGDKAVFVFPTGSHHRKRMILIAVYERVLKTLSGGNLISSEGTGGYYTERTQPDAVVEVA